MFCKKFELIYNDDSDILRYIPPPHSTKKIEYAINYLKSTRVDCFVWCLANIYAYSYQSERVESYFTKLLQSESYDSRKRKDLMYNLYKKGIDYLPILINKCHKAKISFVASFRMNDTHLKSDPKGVLAAKFWQEHQDYRLWGVTCARTYYNACLDYTYLKVRERYLSMIDEVVNKYEVDGIELDFCREPYFFQPSEAWKKRKILTAFIEEVRSILLKAGERKEEIFLILRVPFGDERLAKAGIDLEVWLDRRLSEILVMSNLFNNPNHCIEPWLTKARKNGVLFYPSLEADPDKYNPNMDQRIINPIAPWHSYNPPKIPEVTVKRIYAIVQNYLAQNPDGIYTFNYSVILREGTKERYEDSSVFNALIEPLKEMTVSEKLKRRSKLYNYWTECPILVETGRPAKYYQRIKFLLFEEGIEEEKRRVVIRFIEVAEKNPHAIGDYRQNSIVPAGKIKYTINNEPVSEALIKERGGREAEYYPDILKTHNIVEITLPVGILKYGENFISFEIAKFPEARSPYIYIYQLEVETF